MSDGRETVVFGPFIGEFGWELLYWHGAVRALCNNEFRNHLRIAVSLPGRQRFYPDVDQFIEIKAESLPASYSARGYIADGWRDGLPGESLQRNAYHPLNLYSSLRHRRLGRASYIRRWDGESIEPYVTRLIEGLRRQFPSTTRFITPFQVNEFGDLHFGHDVSVSALDLAKTAIRPLFDKQDLRRLSSSTSAQNFVKQVISSEKKLVAVFPRSRPFRRRDKNWSRQNYLDLGLLLQAKGFDVAFLGAPGGAYFANEDLSPFLDFINIPNDQRLDIHLAVLERSALAVGAMSGSLLVALAAGCPSIIFGDQRQQLRYYEENYLRTPLIYICDMDPALTELDPVISAMENWILDSTTTR
jgi:hypothetical protein